MVKSITTSPNQVTHMDIARFPILKPTVGDTLFRVLLFCVSMLAFILVPGVDPLTADTSEGSEQPATTPSICVGYDHQARKWGYLWSYRLGIPEKGYMKLCPEHSVFFDVDDPPGISGPGKYIRIDGNCCPLPSSDILTDSHVFVNASCPDNHVVTGSEVKHPCDDVKCIFQMRCTKINTDRYQLAEKKPAAFWGIGHNAAFWKENVTLKRTDIPPAIRHAVGREDLASFDIDGCVGIPFGSLLVEKRSKFCTGFYFRQLQYKGRTGDPVRGTPVKMFPDCNDISDIFAQDPQCIH